MSFRFVASNKVCFPKTIQHPGKRCQTAPSSTMCELRGPPLSSHPIVLVSLCSSRYANQVLKNLEVHSGIVGPFCCVFFASAGLLARIMNSTGPAVAKKWQRMHASHIQKLRVLLKALTCPLLLSAAECAGRKTACPSFIDINVRKRKVPKAAHYTKPLYVKSSSCLNLDSFQATTPTCFAPPTGLVIGDGVKHVGWCGLDGI